MEISNSTLPTEVIDRWKGGDIQFEECIKWYCNHWKEFSTEDLSLFRNSIGTSDLKDEELFVLFDLINVESPSSQFLCELYSIINMIIERSMLQMSFPIGGLLLKENEESLPTLRLLPISMATVSSASIQFWLSINQLQHYKEDLYTTVLTITLSTSTITLILDYPSSKNNPFYFHFKIQHAEDEAYETSFPLQLSSIRANLITLSLSYSGILVYQYDKLAGEVDLEDLNDFDPLSLSFGGHSTNHDGVIISSVLVTTSKLSHSSLSLLSQLGPFYSFDGCVPSHCQNNPLLSINQPSLSSSQSSLSLLQWVDFSKATNDTICCLMNCERSLLSSDSYEWMSQQEQQALLLSCSSLLSLSQPLFLRFSIQNQIYRILYNLKQKDNKNEELVIQCLHTLSFLLSADSSLVYSLANNDFSLLLYYYLQDHSISHHFLQSLIDFGSILARSDFSEHLSIFQKYCNTLLFNPLLFHSLSYEEGLYFHNAILDILSSLNPSSPFSILSSLCSFQTYCECIIQKGIIESPSCLTIFSQYEKDIPTLLTSLIEMISSHLPFTSLLPCITALEECYKNPAISDSQLSKQLKEECVHWLLFQLLSYLQEEASSSSPAIEEILYFCCLTFFLFLSLHPKQSNSIRESSEKIYSLIYTVLSKAHLKGEKCCGLYLAWLKNHSIRQWLFSPSHVTTPFCHYHILSSLFYVLRMNHKQEVILSLLPELKQAIDDLAASQVDMNTSVKHAGLFQDSLLNELLLLYQSTSDQMLLDCVVSILIIAMDYVFFTQLLSSVFDLLLHTINPSVLPVFIFQLLSHLITPSFHLLITRCKNMRFLLQCIEEVDVLVWHYGMKNNSPQDNSLQNDYYCREMLCIDGEGEKALILILPLLDLFEQEIQMNFPDYSIYLPMCFLLLRLLYQSVQQKDISAIHSTIQQLHHLFSLIQRNPQLYQNCFSSYLVTLQKCLELDSSNNQLKQEMTDNSKVLSIEISETVFTQFYCQYRESRPLQNYHPLEHISIEEMKLPVSFYWSEQESTLQKEITANKNGWLWMTVSAKKAGLSASPFYLSKCSYYTTDPHISPDGARHKLLKILPSSSSYQSVEDKREKKNEKEKSLEKKESFSSSSLYSSLRHSRHSLLHRESEEEKKNEWRVMLVTTSSTQWGVLQIYNKMLVFQTTSQPEDMKSFTTIAVQTPVLPIPPILVIPLASTKGLLKRSYNCQQSAFELFYQSSGFVDSVYFFFPEMNVRNKVYSLLLKSIPSTAIAQSLNETEEDAMKRLRCDENWMNDQFSNFEYLMRVNWLAGRSYQDITQYPVFPWILNNYDSSSYDVYDRNYYRDLTLPMGAQRKSRLQHYITQYEMLNEQFIESTDTTVSVDVMDDQIPPYFYGSHYSTPLGCVLYYLIRKEPFTSLHICLQGNHFDVPDRLFYSLPVTTHSCLENIPEIKEVIPEFYSDDSYLVNMNKQSFGNLQSGEPVDNVLLPCSPSVLLSRNIQSLESNITTTFLHDWIDLLVGYKQQGKEAVKAYNVFYYLTYPSKCDITDVADDSMRSAVLTQAAHFGQCPHLLFQNPHIKKRINQSVPRYLRNILLESNESSIYIEQSRQWLGHYCRIQSISDYSPSMLSSLSSLQSILGSNHVYFPSIYSSSTSIETPVYLTWPSESSYPWCLTIDNCELMDMVVVKVQLQVKNALSYNTKTHCFTVSYYTEQNEWKEIQLTNESMILQEDTVVATLSFNSIITRYWKLTILDIPFTLQYITPSVTTHPAYTTGDASRDVQAKTIQTSSRQGPCIQLIDVMARKLFPHVPPKGTMIGSFQSLQFTAIWSNHLAIVNQSSIQLYSLLHPDHTASYALDELQAIQFTLLAIHPSLPLLFASTPVAGQLLIIVINNTLSSSSSSPIHSIHTYQVSSSPLVCCFCEDSFLVIHSLNGCLSTFALSMETKEHEVSIHSIQPLHSINTPSFHIYQSITCNLGMDCISLYDPKQGILIYTSLLELRGMIHLSNCHACFLSLYGMFMMVDDQLIKYSYCGDKVNELNIPSGLTCGCLTKRGDILLVATKEGDYLFIDTIENRVLTRIPEKQPVNCLLINESMTGVYTYSIHHTLHFYQFNNCITPILSLKKQSKKGTKMRERLKSIFK